MPALYIQYVDYLEIGIGIAVSVILFLVGYRQTIGAKKVRAESAFNEIGQILLRNLVDRNYVLTISEINRIIQAKCIEKKIKINDLPDEITFINVLFTRIAEDEILSCDKKNEYMQLD
jgi:hypothetical protein